ncbi:hypothetical protein EKO27_g5598 [Xylaria grammica]|uniref:Tat pathway signal sequence n=1 Tax=Xylaria grammica TaxID=363999 RepID=A0A439D518_9PEZI|nr:hypothetical protein EKO27_g5598 [Xylaria grammica]
MPGPSNTAVRDFAPGEPLNNLEKAGNEACCQHCGSPYNAKERRHGQFIVFSLVLFVLLAIVGNALMGQLIPGMKHPDPTLRLFSPANDIVEYEHHVFDRSRGEDKTPFQGWPSDEIDKTWQDAYIAGMLTTVDHDTAKQLPEETERLPVPGREDEYLVTLDVFHQMHCLDIVRMALYPQRYDKSFYLANGTIDYCKWLHVDHCIDQLRQALLCNSDVSVVYYKWSDVVEGIRPMVNNQHTCRNYDKVLEWAKERNVGEGDWHPSRRVIEEDNGTFSIFQGRNHALGDEGECNAI